MFTEKFLLFILFAFALCCLAQGDDVQGTFPLNPNDLIDEKKGKLQEECNF